MLDVKLAVSEHTNQENRKIYDVVSDDSTLRFDSETGFLEIPEDYYLDIYIRYTEVLEGDLEDISPRIVIGEDSYYCGFLSEEGLWHLEWRPELAHCGRPFFGLPGVHEIRIQSFLDREEYFEESFQVEVLATRARAREITTILDFINDDYDAISQMCLDGNPENNGVIADLINEAERTYILCKSLWSVLLRQLRYILEPRLDVTPNGLPNSPEAIHWLSLNSDAVALCSPYEQTFQINNMPVKTEFAAEEKMIPSYRLFENLVIAGFINHIRMKLSAVKDFINGHEQSQQRPDGESLTYPGYCRYSGIVHGVLSKNLQNQYSRVMNLLDGFYKLYTSFEKVTGINYLDKPLMPRITPFVARTLVYRKLFEQVAKWYGVSAVTLTLNDFTSHFKKIEKLYEFMVLSRIVNVVSQLGGICVSREWHDMSVDHFGGRVAERPLSEPFNYYRWLSENKEYTLELWYEPKIFTVGRTDDEEPMVVCSKNYGRDFYYTPDFVIRIRWEASGFVDYLIMDAKYSSYDTVRKASLPMLVNKYMNSIRVKNALGFDSGIRGVLAIYSRGNVNRFSEYASVHDLDSEYPVFPSIAGVAVRPVADKEKNEKNIKEYLSLFIGNLRKVHHAEYERVIKLARRLQGEDSVK